MNQKQFIFDLDGTLAYTIDDMRVAVNRAYQACGFSAITTEQALDNINFGARVFVTRGLPPAVQSDERVVDAVYAKYCEYYAEEYDKNTYLYPGVAEGIASLKARGARMAVFSNKQDAQTKDLCQKLFPRDTFVIALGSGAGFPPKPSPEGARYVASLLGGCPENTVLIGDSDVDMALAANSGMRVVGVSWGYRSPELLRELGAERILSNGREIAELADLV